MHMQIVRNAIAIRSHCVRILIQILDNGPINTVSLHTVTADQLFYFVVVPGIVVVRKIEAVDCHGNKKREAQIAAVLPL